MIIRFLEIPDKIFVFEAVSRGVRLSDWCETRKSIGPEKHYAHVAIRHVDFNRSSQMYIRQTQMIDEALGLKYELT